MLFHLAKPQEKVVYPALFVRISDSQSRANNGYSLLVQQQEPDEIKTLRNSPNRLEQVKSEVHNGS